MEAEGDSDYALSAMSSSKKSRKGRGSKHNAPAAFTASDSGSGKQTNVYNFFFVITNIQYFLILSWFYISWLANSYYKKPTENGFCCVVFF